MTVLEIMAAVATLLSALAAMVHLGWSVWRVRQVIAKRPRK
jgi:hypothetical protein